MATILIIEDEASIRKLTAVNLAARGHMVVAVASAEEGLIECRRQQVVLILLDIKLPGMHGWEFLNTMAADPSITPGIPVIIMTASAADAHRSAPFYPNVVRVFIKPFNTSELMQAVAQALQ